MGPRWPIITRAPGAQATGGCCRLGGHVPRSGARGALTRRVALTKIPAVASCEDEMAPLRCPFHRDPPTGLRPGLTSPHKTAGRWLRPFRPELPHAVHSEKLLACAWDPEGAPPDTCLSTGSGKRTFATSAIAPCWAVPCVTQKGKWLVINRWCLLALLALAARPVAAEKPDRPGADLHGRPAARPRYRTPGSPNVGCDSRPRDPEGWEGRSNDGGHLANAGQHEGPAKAPQGTVRRHRIAGVRAARPNPCRR